MTETTPITQETPPPYRGNIWRIATIICLILLSVAAATGMSMMEQFKAQLEHVQAKLKTLPQVRYIAVLQDDKQQPGQLITFDPQDGYLQVQRLTDIQEGREQSLQLWALDADGRALSLGVLTPKIKTAQVHASDKILSQAKGLAVSVEIKGGVEAGSPPRLPYLFTGALIKKAL